MNKFKKGAGVLLPISALPGKYGMGSLGKDAYRFAKLLSHSAVKFWQILPLAQTGDLHSPFAGVASDSGNPYFLDLDILAKDKLLTKEELKGARSRRIDYDSLGTERIPLLRTAFSRFNFDSKSFRNYIASGASENYALYMTAKTVYGGSFRDWDEPLRRRDPEALEHLRTEHHEEYLFWNFLQYEFHKQWSALRRYLKGVGVKLIGDLPFYCAADSADVWAHPELFALDESLQPLTERIPGGAAEAAGYDWEANAKEGYAWWKARVEDALTKYDYVRIGGFSQFPAAKEAFPAADRIIAEDLQTDLTESLRSIGAVNAKVLLFAFDGDENNANLPHNFAGRCAVYTGTHDNDTVSGYFSSLSAEEFILLRSRIALELERLSMTVRLGADEGSLLDALIRLALGSDAEIAVFPMQDVLGLDSDARINLPGTTSGNWQFRLDRQPSAHEMGRLKKFIKIYRR